MRALSVTFALVVAAAGSAVGAQEVPPRPVVITPVIFDGKPIDQGGAWARIVGLKKGGDGFVSVRAAPSTRAAERDRLTADRLVYALGPERDWRRLGFVGVVYTEGGAPEDFEERCGLAAPLPKAPPWTRVYDGPCRSGWIHARFVEVLAD